jgi:protein ImuB
MACVDVPVLPLQLLLRQNPGWKEHAAAVVAEDRPQAPLLYVNEAARRTGVLPGQKFAGALGLAKDLRAGTIASVHVERSVREITELLRRHSPDVEPDVSSPGVFWIDAGGLHRLHPSLVAWARGIAAALEASQLAATVVVGFSRFGTYAVAKSGRGVKVFSSAADEDAAMRRVPLRRLDVDPELRDRLDALGMKTAGDFLGLPAGGLRRRFGEAAYRLHCLAAGKAWAPLQPVPYVEPHQREAELEAPDGDAQRLLFLIKQLLDSLLAQLARRSEALALLTLRLVLDNHTEYSESLRPAAATLDGVQILGLVRLRLETLRLTSGVVELRVSAEGVRATAGQIEMFRVSRRDPEAAHRAFARLRAELGEDAVVRAALREGHLPAARFAWERMDALPDRMPQPRDVSPRPLVRRIYHAPIALPPRPRHEPDGWLLRGLEHGRVETLSGPYVVSGGWWGRRGAHREYYFARMSRGELLWIYHDKKRRRFFLEGRVE